MERRFWKDLDDGKVEKLIAALQATVAEHGETTADGIVNVAAPDLTAALLALLASVLEGSPDCRTPLGLRTTAEAAGKELLTLMRETRSLREPADSKVR